MIRVLQTLKQLESDAIFVPYYVYKNEFLINGKWRRLNNSELRLVLAIYDLMSESDMPSLIVPLSELAFLANQSISTARKNKDILVESGLIHSERSGSTKSYKITLCDPKTIHMREPVA